MKNDSLFYIKAKAELAKIKKKQNEKMFICCLDFSISDNYLQEYIILL